MKPNDRFAIVILLQPLLKGVARVPLAVPRVPLAVPRVPLAVSRVQLDVPRAPLDVREIFECHIFADKEKFKDSFV
jgi:hypothetical protein